MHADARAAGLVLSPLPLRADGGASSNQLLMQMQADILGMAVLRPADVETTALGAALAAGVALQLWSPDDLFSTDQSCSSIVQFSPRLTQEECAVQYARWQKAVRKAVGWAQAEAP